MTKSTTLIPAERIENAILLIRGQKVLLDADLADLYEVDTRTLVQAVKRNIERFPDDFMFQLSREEHEILRSQIVTSNQRGSRRYWPYAFTEQGVAMLSSVPRCPMAVQVNIEIMRAFIRLRGLLTSHDVFAAKLKALAPPASGFPGRAPSPATHHTPTSARPPSLRVASRLPAHRLAFRTSVSRQHRASR